MLGDNETATSSSHNNSSGGSSSENEEDDADNSTTDTEGHDRLHDHSNDCNYKEVSGCTTASGSDPSSGRHKKRIKLSLGGSYKASLSKPRNEENIESGAVTTRDNDDGEKETSPIRTAIKVDEGIEPKKSNSKIGRAHV